MVIGFLVGYWLRADFSDTNNSYIDSYLAKINSRYLELSDLLKTVNSFVLRSLLVI